MEVDGENELQIYDIMTKLPNDLEMRKHERLQHNDIHKLSKAFEMCVVVEWEEFGEICLGLSYAVTENIQQDYDKKRALQIHKVFEKWLEEDCENATVVKMIDILEKANLDGIKQLWFSKYKDEHKSQIKKFMDDREKSILKWSRKHISDGDWADILIKLDITDQENNVKEKYPKKKQKQRQEILRRWGNRFGYSREMMEKLESVFRSPKSVSQEHAIQLSKEKVAKRRPFLLRPFSPNIKVCQGCRQLFAVKPSKGGMVIAHYEEIEYKNDQGQLVKTEGNGHYHNDIRCVRVKHPDFERKQIMK